MKHTVQITIDGVTSDLPVLEASVGLDVVDVRSLIQKGLFYQHSILGNLMIGMNIVLGSNSS